MGESARLSTSVLPFSNNKREKKKERESFIPHLAHAGPGTAASSLRLSSLIVME